jgi:DNA invertase Pin-like site-specific DNA recombinase
VQAAIYARRSPDEDSSRSIERQIAHARAYALKKGWEVLEDHIYTDDGISGAEFRNRPGLLRLLNGLRPRASFGAVIMSEAARLGRERLRTELVARDLFEAGVRIFYYLTDEEEKLDTSEQRFVMAARGFAAEMEREKSRQRTRDALLARARLGHVTGGVVFGFRNVAISAGVDASGNQRRSHVCLEVDPVEAEIVRSIYRMYVDGYGHRKIARTLNADPALAAETRRYFGGVRVPPPRKGSGSWAPGCVRAILLNERYRGKIVWGRYRNTDRAGRTRCRAPQDSSMWVIKEVEALRIVPEDLWTAAQARRPRATQGRDYRTARRGVSPSLLSGISTCSTCGGPIVVTGSAKRQRCYACGYRRNRGSTVCENDLYESVRAVDDSLIDEIDRVVLTPEARRYTLERAAELLRSRKNTAADRTDDLQRQLTRVKREAENLLRAVEAGEPPQLLLERLREKGLERSRIELEIRNAAAAVGSSPRDMKQVWGVLEDLLSNLRETLRSDIVAARRALSTLLVGRVRFTPLNLENGVRTYELKAELTLGTVLSFAAQTCNVPDGI